MKIIVAMKQIPDLQQIRIKDRKPLLEDIPLTFARIDKNALEAAVQLKESSDDEVIVVSTGGEDLEDTIKEALAADADSAVLLVDNAAKKLEGVQTAALLAELIKKVGQYDIALFGEGSGDNYSGQMGSRVAELLGLPQVGFVSDIKINGSTATLIRSLENYDEVLEVQLPAVITVVGDLNTPRIPSVSKVLKAGRKPKEIFNLADLNTAMDEAQVETLSNLAPVMNRKGVALKSVSELVETLKAEGFGGK